MPSVCRLHERPGRGAQVLGGVPVAILDLEIGVVLDEQFGDVLPLAEDGVVERRLPFVVLDMERQGFSI